MINPIFVLMLMIFLHIVDDYYLQGILASLKQKSWWQANAPEKKYRFDYIVGLIMHSFSWSFMIMLPCFFIATNVPAWWIFFMFGANIFIHAIVDDLKANRKKINLITDQSIHLVQILLTWLIWLPV